MKKNMKKNPFRIDWSVFEGSSFCEDGIVMFGTGEIKNYHAWHEWHLPHMKEQAEYVLSIKKNLPLNVARKRALSKSYKEGW